ncbi:Alpha/beta hydrolase domain-containing protein 17C, partial [Trichinella patagoniensis]
LPLSVCPLLVGRTKYSLRTMASSTSSSIQLTFRDLCCLFCCPPFPSSIVAKLAFMPPTPSYNLTPDDSSDDRLVFSLVDRTEWPFSDQEMRQMEFFYTRTSRGNKLTCMFMRCCPGAKYVILFSHGNAVDLGQMCSFYYSLGVRVGCNIFSYDYSGYGRSSGKPSEKNLYADISAALNALRQRYNITNDAIILYGQSIGTVPTVDLASKCAVAAVILHSPLMSGLRVAFPETNRTWCFDAFPSIEKIEKVSAPTLVIHGTEDEVIDFHHGLQIYERCPKAVEPLWVHGAGHNDVETSPAYLDRLRQFIEVEVGGDVH